MTMPKPNYWVNQLDNDTDVTLEGTTNQYYVATINGIKGVVSMDGQHRREQQRYLNTLVQRTLRRKEKEQNEQRDSKLQPILQQLQSLAPNVAVQIQSNGDILLTTIEDGEIFTQRSDTNKADFLTLVQAAEALQKKAKSKQLSKATRLLRQELEKQLTDTP